MSRIAPKDDERYASAAEASFALAALSSADLARLGRIAQMRAHNLPGVGWEDLLNEAIEKLLSGVRRWPLDLPLVAFLREVIRSLASEAWRRHAQARLVQAPPEGEGDSDPVLSVPDTSAGPERDAIARDLLKHVRGLFKDDPQVLAILDGLGVGLDPEDIQRSTGMSAIDYESSRRRLRRRLARHFPEGLEA